jgi:hypothetical protein
MIDYSAGSLMPGGKVDSGYASTNEMKERRGERFGKARAGLRTIQRRGRRVVCADI